MFFGRALIQLGILGLVSVVGTIGVSAGPPKPILTVSGMTGSGGPVPIDMAAIESLPQHTFRIIDPWEKIPRTYTGPLVTDVLELAGVPRSASVIDVIAKDGYHIPIRRSDLERYRHILSHSMNGKSYVAFQRSPDKGPLAIAIEIPQGEMEIEIYKYHFVWKVNEFVARK